MPNAVKTGLGLPLQTMEKNNKKFIIKLLWIRNMKEKGYDQRW